MPEQEWEYRVEPVGASDLEALKDYLNQFALLGWELVTLMPADPAPGIPLVYTGVFRRNT